MLQKKMFKVVSPIEKKNGGTYWMRLGSAFTNKDDSINVYLDAVPLGKEVTIQLRELTEDDLRERAEKRATYTARGTLSSSSLGAGSPGSFNAHAAPSSSSSNEVPF